MSRQLVRSYRPLHNQSDLFPTGEQAIIQDLQHYGISKSDLQNPQKLFKIVNFLEQGHAQASPEALKLLRQSIDALPIQQRRAFIERFNDICANITNEVPLLREVAAGGMPLVENTDGTFVMCIPGSRLNPTTQEWRDTHEFYCIDSTELARFRSLKPELVEHEFRGYLAEEALASRRRDPMDWEWKDSAPAKRTMRCLLL
jgi:hypothetical protein